MLGNKLYVGSITESDAQPTGVQLKRKAKLLTITVLTMQTAASHLCYTQYVHNVW